MGSSASKAGELKAVLQKGNVVLLDVRSAGEVAAQSLQTSMDVLNIPVGSVGAEATEAIPDKDANLIVFCRSGMRSSSAIGVLKSLGYSNLYNGGGVSDFQKVIDDN